jgi:hypothetical protein
MFHDRQPRLLAAAPACAAAALLCVVTLVRAFDAAPAPALAVPAAAPAQASEPTAPNALSDGGAVAPPAARSQEPDTRPAGSGADAAPPLTPEQIGYIADHDPFRSDRQRPDFRYRLPGDPLPEEPYEPPPPPPPPPFRLVGTASGPAGGLAVIQVGDSPPMLVAVGESILGYTLARVAGDDAVLEGELGSLPLQLTSQLAAARQRPQPQARQAPRPGQTRPGAGGQPQPVMRQELEEMRRRLLEAAGARGQILEGNVQVRMDGDRAVIIRSDTIRRDTIR